MNGVASTSMRRRGYRYKVIFGLTLPQIKAIASTLPRRTSLAENLWCESIRESKILATLLLPDESVTVELAECWLAAIDHDELIDFLAMNVFSRLPSPLEWAITQLDRADLCSSELFCDRFPEAGCATLARCFTLRTRPTHEQQRAIDTWLLDRPLTIRIAAMLRKYVRLHESPTSLINHFQQHEALHEELLLESQMLRGEV